MCHVPTCRSEGWLRVSWDQAAIYLWSHLDGDFKNVLSCELSGFPPSYGFQGLNSVNLAGQTLLSTELKRDFLWEPGLSPSELQACAFGSLDFFRFFQGGYRDVCHYCLPARNSRDLAGGNWLIRVDVLD